MSGDLNHRPPSTSPIRRCTVSEESHGSPHLSFVVPSGYTPMPLSPDQLRGSKLLAGNDDMGFPVSPEPERITIALVPKRETLAGQAAAENEGDSSSVLFEYCGSVDGSYTAASLLHTADPTTAATSKGTKWGAIVGSPPSRPDLRDESPSSTSRRSLTFEREPSKDRHMVSQLLSRSTSVGQDTASKNHDVSEQALVPQLLFTSSLPDVPTIMLTPAPDLPEDGAEANFVPDQQSFMGWGSEALTVPTARLCMSEDDWDYIYAYERRAVAEGLMAPEECQEYQPTDDVPAENLLDCAVVSNADIDGSVSSSSPPSPRTETPPLESPPIGYYNDTSISATMLCDASELTLPTAEVLSRHESSVASSSDNTVEEEREAPCREPSFVGGAMELPSPVLAPVAGTSTVSISPARSVSPQAAVEEESLIMRTAGDEEDRGPSSTSSTDTVAAAATPPPPEVDTLPPLRRSAPPSSSTRALGMLSPNHASMSASPNSKLAAKIESLWEENILTKNINQKEQPHEEGEGVQRTSFQKTSIDAFCSDAIRLQERQQHSLAIYRATTSNVQMPLLPEDVMLSRMGLDSSSKGASLGLGDLLNRDKKMSLDASVDDEGSTIADGNNDEPSSNPLNGSANFSSAVTRLLSTSTGVLDALQNTSASCGENDVLEAAALDADRRVGGSDLVRPLSPLESDEDDADRSWMEPRSWVPQPHAGSRATSSSPRKDEPISSRDDVQSPSASVRVCKPRVRFADNVHAVRPFASLLARGAFPGLEVEEFVAPVDEEDTTI